MLTQLIKYLASWYIGKQLNKGIASTSLQHKRLKECNTCENRVVINAFWANGPCFACKNCGCDVIIKSKAGGETCPLNKW